MNSDQQAVAPTYRGYFVRHRGLNLLFRLLDGVMRVIRLFRPSDQPRPIRRILIANGAHLGDVVLATTVLPAIKSAFPDAKIGMLIGSWSRMVVEGHALLDWVHVVDHWKINRTDKTAWQRIRHYQKTRRVALRELREVDYDAAVDLYFYFPNTFLLLHQAKIPVRIGYTSGGFGPLLTRALDFKLTGRSIVEYHNDLLRQIPGVGLLDTASAISILPRIGSFPAHLVGSNAYVVIHMGSGSSLKDWPTASWRQLAESLIQRGFRLVFTGSGKRERLQIEAIVRSTKHGLDLSDKLSWADFVEVVAHARLLIGVDSVAGHVAAAVNTPVIVISHGMNNPMLWRPVGERVEVMMHPMPCAPCYRKSGCQAMSCIRDLSPNIVLSRVESISNPTG